MPFKVELLESDGVHQWAVVSCECDPTQHDDAVLLETVDAVRRAYGEDTIIELAEKLQPDPGVALRFDLGAIRHAIRKGLPDPAAEGGKKPHLTNYRSEACEMVAKGALEAAYQMQFPVAPQQGKPNANQPILGFDHWGILNKGTTVTLALVQVKGTQDTDIPPPVAAVLAAECVKVPNQIGEICRTLTVLALALNGMPLQSAIIAMLEAIGRNQPIEIAVAPVIVRGGPTGSSIDDLQPCRTASQNFAPAAAYGATVYVRAELTEFGKAVMERARAA